MKLYTDAQSVKKDTCTISSKNAFLTFFLLSASFFAVSSIIFVYQRLCAFAP